MSTVKEQNQELLNKLIDLHSRGELVGAYENIPIEIYHHPSCPGISSTQLKTVLKRSWAHLQYEKEDTDELAFGRLFHDFISDPKSIQKRLEEDKKSHTQVFLAEKMFKNMMRHPIIRSLMQGAKHEVTFFSKDEETGILKKCRADGIQLDEKIVFDFKTTRNAGLESFLADCRWYNYRLSAAYYLEIISEVMGERFEDFRLIPCEKEEPCEAAIYRVHSRSIEEASMDIRAGLNKIKLAIDGGNKGWAGYSLDNTDILI